MRVTAYPPYNIDPSASSVSLAKLFESITNKKVFYHLNMINLLSEEQGYERPSLYCYPNPNSADCI